MNWVVEIFNTDKLAYMAIYIYMCVCVLVRLLTINSNFNEKY